MSTIDRFVRKLARTEVPENAFNQYGYDGEAGRWNRIRRANLKRYLHALHSRETRSILVGEAPSYRGCRLTGVPFMSESLMLRGVDEASMFGRDRGYVKTDEWEKPSGEASATIVWSAIRSQPQIPLLWNAFPFHPFREGNRDSNRPPTARELEIGGEILDRLLRLFRIERVIAVGNKAAVCLGDLGVAHTKIRHPARGGQRLFVEGVRRWL